MAAILERLAATSIVIIYDRRLDKYDLDSSFRTNLYYTFPTKHTENVMFRVHEAHETLMLAEKYMGELGRGIDNLSKIKLTDKKVMELMQDFFPVTNDMPDVQRKNNMRLLDDMKRRYWDAPDLSNMDRNG